MRMVHVSFLGCVLFLISGIIAKAETAVVSVTATDDYASEKSPPGIINKALFTFTRTGNLTNSLLVTFSLSGTATPMIDYPSISNSIQIPAGAASVSVPVEAIYSRDVEPTESVILTLLASDEYSVAEPSNAVVSIWKNDYNDPSLPIVVIWSDGSGSEHIFSGGYVNTVVFTFYRGGPTNQPLAIEYNFSGTAFAGVDYANGLSNVITIPAGSDRAYFEIWPIDDAIVEGAESLIVEISAKSNYTIGSRQRAEAIVFDDDSGSVPTINSEWLGASNEKLTFKVNGATGQSFLIFGSTNLVDWTLALTNAIPAGGSFIEPTNSTSASLRFFRAVPLE